jgi:hypothetical protein
LQTLRVLLGFGKLFELSNGLIGGAADIGEMRATDFEISSADIVALIAVCDNWAGVTFDRGTLEWIAKNNNALLKKY